MHLTQSTGKHFYAILESYAHLLLNLFKIVAIFFPNFSSFVEEKFDLLKGKLKVIPLLCQLGPKFGYYPEIGKSWLIIKGNQEYAADVFRGTSIKITADGQQHLEAFIGSTSYKRIYIQEKISQWIKELQMLC